MAHKRWTVKYLKWMQHFWMKTVTQVMDTRLKLKIQDGCRI